MNALWDLEGLGLQVGWQTALIGWDGPAANERQVESHEVVDLAVRKLIQTPGLSGDILQLASVVGNEEEVVDLLLRRLAKYEQSSVDLELRKWRLLLLSRCLAELPEDPLYSWTNLAGFWHSFDFPGDCPAIIHGFDELPAVERYTPQMRSMLLTVHEEWLTSEISAISAAEAVSGPKFRPITP